MSEKDGDPTAAYAAVANGLGGVTGRRARVALVTEGSYPCSPGGVSVWCDQLMNNLPQIDFHLIAISLTDRDRWIWTPPANVVEVEHFGVWDRVRDRVRRGRTRACPAPLRALIGALTGPVAPSFDDELRVLTPAFDAVVSMAVDGTLGRYLTFETLRDPVIEALGASDYLQQRYEVTLADSLDITAALMHLLAPLTIDAGPVDVVHATANGLPALVGLAAQARYGTPFMLTEHGLYLRERYIGAPVELRRPVVKDVMLRYHRLIAATALRRATVLAPASDFNARWQMAMGADPLRVGTLYNGVDPLEFPLRDHEVGEPHVVWLGRIDPLKDLHTLIRAADIVRGQAPDVRFRLFGEAPAATRGYLDSCRSLVDELDLEANVTFEGRASHPVDVFHAGQFSLLSSISEGFPYTVLESMSCGVPVVGTSVGGVPEAIADTGYIVPPRNPDAMATACLDMLAAYDRRQLMGTAARDRVERLFARELMLLRHDELYSSWASGEPVPAVGRPPSSIDEVQAGVGVDVGPSGGLA